MVDGSMIKLMSKSDFALLSSFQLRYERVVIGSGGQNHIDCQSKHGLSHSSVKTGKLLPGGSQEQKTCTFLGPKVKNAICNGTTPHLHTKHNLGKCRGPKSSNRIELSQFVQVLLHI